MATKHTLYMEKRKRKSSGVVGGKTKSLSRERKDGTNDAKTRDERRERTREAERGAAARREEETRPNTNDDVSGWKLVGRSMNDGSTTRADTNE